MSTATDRRVWTVGGLLQWTREWFARQEVDEPRLSAELLLAHALGCAKIELYTRFETTPDEPAVSTFRALVRRAGAGEPIAYLLECREFFSLSFAVTPAVLIPRPETETLVQAVVDHCRGESDRKWKILDVGTGTGCIAVGLATYVPNAAVTATDISSEALAVARRNVAAHDLEERVRLAEADWLDLPADLRAENGFDVIASNPPYIAEPEFLELSRTVRDHEPRVALDGGADGLGSYRRLAEPAPDVLAPGGCVFVEIGCGQRDAVVAIFEQAERFTHRGTWSDLARIDRVLRFDRAATNAECGVRNSE